MAFLESAGCVERTVFHPQEDGVFHTPYADFDDE